MMQMVDNDASEASTPNSLQRCFELQTQLSNLNKRHAELTCQHTKLKQLTEVPNLRWVRPWWLCCDLLCASLAV